jgi:transposase
LNGNERWFEIGDFERKSDGRRIFNTGFKRQAVDRIRSGDTTVAALSRELSVAPALIRRWIKLSESGSAAAVDAGEDVVPVSRVRELERQIKELQRLIGKQAVTIEILEDAREVAKKSPHLFRGSKR